MEQLSIFDLLSESKPLPSNIKLLSLFSGIGAFEKALDNLGIGYELVGYCEIDKYASKSYSAIHGVSEDMNLWDVTKVDEKALPKDIDLITYGFPCQDISLAGKQKGLFNEDGSKTRSGLFFDALRIIEETKPRVAIAENVKNLVGKKFNAQFQVVLASLEAAGYNNYWAVLNSKDFGVPQNRERVFIVSIYKDFDKGLFEFPKGFPLEKRLKDVLEETVDEKYYLSDKMIDYISQNGTKNFRNADCKINCAIARPLTTDQNKRAGTTNYLCEDLPENFDIGCIKDEPIRLGGLYDTETSKHQAGSIWDKDAISPTLDTMQGGNRQPFITVDDDSVKAGAVISEPLAYDEQNCYIRQDGIVGTLTTDGSSPKHNNRVLVWDGYNQRIRADQSCVGTLTQNCGADLKRNGQGIIEPTIQRIDIPQTVKVRKYPIDCKLLCKCLRDSKEIMDLSNKEIAKALNLPITKVEHWFRQDDCFAIPDADIWMDLKTLLGITTDEFDESIMTFEEKEGVFEKSERHYLSEGVAPTLTSTTAAEKVIEPSLRIRKLTPKECYRLMGFDDEDFHKAEAVNSNTQLYKQAGNSIVVDVLERILKQIFKAI